MIALNGSAVKSATLNGQKIKQIDYISNGQRNTVYKAQTDPVKISVSAQPDYDGAIFGVNWHNSNAYVCPTGYTKLYVDSYAIVADTGGADTELFANGARIAYGRTGLRFEPGEDTFKDGPFDIASCSTLMLRFKASRATSIDSRHTEDNAYVTFHLE